MPSTVVCKVCREKYARYTCPRCIEAYCSLECYKRHNLSCTETFYKQQVEEELHSRRAEDEDRKRLREILQRFHEQSVEERLSEDESDDAWVKQLSQEDITHIEKAGEEIDLTYKVPSTVIAEFEELLRTQKVSNLVEIYSPWWESAEVEGFQLSSNGTALVQDLREGEKSLQTDLPRPPHNPIPSLTSLTNTSKVSPLVRWQLLQIILGYCFILRRYNGDWRWDLVYIGSLLKILVSCFDAKSPSLLSTEQTTEEFMERVSSPPIGSRKEQKFVNLIFQDALKLISEGRSVAILALNEMLTILRVIRNFKKKKKKKQQEEGFIKWLKSGERKVYFLLSWANFPENSTLLIETSTELQQIIEDLQTATEVKPIGLISDETKPPVRVLITEI